MQKYFFTKIIFLLFVAVAAMGYVTFDMLKGPALHRRPLELLPTRFSAPTFEEVEKSLTRNVRVKTFLFETKKPTQFYKQGEAIRVLCMIENNSNENIANFRSVIRTNEKEIKSLVTPLLKAGKTIVVEGSFAPQDGGVLIVACRADVDEKIEEKNEGDNKAVEALYIGS